jgi:hypothetical protein
MKTWGRLKELERRIDAEARLPPLLKTDSPSVNLRTIFVERIGAGAQKLTPAMIQKIQKTGYDNYLLSKLGRPSQVGTPRFEKLRDEGLIELTDEFIAFHHFREQLKPEVRREIARVLASALSSATIETD